MIRLFLLTVQILLLIPSFCLASKAYYVDPTAPSDGNGSYSTPWNSISQVNNHSFSNGDNLYFRAGTDLHITQQFQIRWNGTESNRVTIGAYHISGGQPVMGLGGNPRPILDAKKKIPTSPTAPLIYHNGPGYITIQDLHIKNSYGIGLRIGELYYSPMRVSLYNIIKNCIIQDSGQQGILLARNHYSLVENNIIDGTSQERVPTAARPDGVWSGSALEISGMNTRGASFRNTARGNTITRAFESLGIYQGSRETTIENNFVYDFVQCGIYAANAQYGIIRNNVVYQPDPTNAGYHPAHPRPTRGALIWLDSEGHVANVVKETGDWKIYGNYLAGGSTGIALECNSNNLGVYQKNNTIYENRIVDCDRNFLFRNAHVNWYNNQIYNNYSFIFTPGLVHTNDMSPPGVVWDANYFNSSVTGNASRNARIREVSLNTEKNWRFLTQGNVSVELFGHKNEILETKIRMVEGFSITVH